MYRKLPAATSYLKLKQNKCMCRKFTHTYEMMYIISFIIDADTINHEIFIYFCLFVVYNYFRKTFNAMTLLSATSLLTKLDKFQWYVYKEQRFENCQIHNTGIPLEWLHSWGEIYIFIYFKYFSPQEWSHTSVVNLAMEMLINNWLWHLRKMPPRPNLRIFSLLLIFWNFPENFTPIEWNMIKICQFWILTLTFEKRAHNANWRNFRFLPLFWTFPENSTGKDPFMSKIQYFYIFIPNFKNSPVNLICQLSLF